MRRDWSILHAENPHFYIARSLHRSQSRGLILIEPRAGSLRSSFVLKVARVHVVQPSLVVSFLLSELLTHPSTALYPIAEFLAPP